MSWSNFMDESMQEPLDVKVQPSALLVCMLSYSVMNVNNLKQHIKQFHPEACEHRTDH